MIAFVDNFDSFTYNLVALFEKYAEVKVLTNEEATVERIRELNPKVLVISPGPGNPDDAGHSLELVKEFSEKIAIFGVCLGHQVIAQALGGEVSHASRIVHGKRSQIFHQGSGMFQGLKQGFMATRYHSLIAKPTHPNLEIVATSDDGEVMAIRSKSGLTVGVQFHPESYASECGEQLVENFMKDVA